MRQLARQGFRAGAERAIVALLWWLGDTLSRTARAGVVYLGATQRLTLAMSDAATILLRPNARTGFPLPHVAPGAGCRPALVRPAPAGQSRSPGEVDPYLTLKWHES
jgi:hypothetical protein